MKAEQVSRVFMPSKQYTTVYCPLRTILTDLGLLYFHSAIWPIHLTKFTAADLALIASQIICPVRILAARSFALRFAPGIYNGYCPLIIQTVGAFGLANIHAPDIKY